MIANVFGMKKHIKELQALSEKELDEKLVEVYKGKYNMSIDDIAEVTMIQQIITTKRLVKEGFAR